jgi:Integrase zinc binding domain/Integrase core domain
MERNLYQRILKFLKEEKYPEELEEKQQKKWRNFCKPFQEQEGVLFRVTKWKDPVKVLQQGETEAILYIYHNDPVAGHFGSKKTFEKIRRTYFWPQMYEEIKSYVESCHTCQMQSRGKKNNELNPIQPTAPWERVGIDFVGPLSITERGNRYIITAIDYFTRWPEARAVKEATAEEAAKFIYEELICRHGIIDVIHTDQGTHFVNEMITALTQRFDMRHHKITAYHPQANGLVERFNGTLKKTLAKISDELHDWDKFIAPALFAYRSTPIETIGTSPAYLEFGRAMKLPKEANKNETIWERMSHLIREVPIIRKNALQKLIKNQEKMKQQYNVKQTDFKVGQQVLLKKEVFTPWQKALEPKWEGPFEILERYSHGTYLLKNYAGIVAKPINGDRLKLYKNRSYLEPIVVVETL